MRPRLVGGIVAAATAAVVIAGCSSPSTPAAAPSGAPASAAPSSAAAVSAEHNNADVTFAQGMIPHHEQAIAMSSQAGTRAASQEVKDLAARIDQGQGPEIQQMTQMLQAWGAPRPQPGASSMPGMAMGAMPMQGMMSNDQMQQLATLSGPAFDRTFLQMMMQHHAGAIQMAQLEQAQGLNPQAKQLAGAIIAAQQQEITEMQAMLSRV